MKKKIEDFKIVELLNHEDISYVSLAICDGVKYALHKIEKSKLLEKIGLQSLKRLIRGWKKLSHTNLLSLEHYFEDKKYVYLAYEYAPNGSFNRYIYKKCLTESEAFVYFIQTVLATEYIHYKGLVHRNLRPENLLLDQNGNVKVSGMLHSVFQDELNNEMMGPLDYMAPEMAQGLNYDHRIDIWALGIILYEILHGKSPFRNYNYRLYREALQKPQLDIKFDNISEDAKSLILGLLEPKLNCRLTFSQIFEHPWVVKRAQQFQLNLNECRPSKRDSVTSKAPQTTEERQTDSFFVQQDDIKQAISPQSGSKLVCESMNLITETSELQQSGTFDMCQSMSQLSPYKPKPLLTRQRSQLAPEALYPKTQQEKNFVSPKRVYLHPSESLSFLDKLKGTFGFSCLKKQ